MCSVGSTGHREKEEEKEKPLRCGSPSAGKEREERESFIKRRWVPFGIERREEEPTCHILKETDFSISK